MSNEEGGGGRRGKEGEGRRRSEEGESLEYTCLLLCLPLVESDGEGEEGRKHCIQVTPIQQVTKKPATDQKLQLVLFQTCLMKM